MTTSNSPATATDKTIVVRFYVPEEANYSLRAAAGRTSTNKNDFMAKVLVDYANNDLVYPVFDSYRAMLNEAEQRDEITVCDRWLEPNGEGLINFTNDMGPRPSMTHFLYRKWTYNSQNQLTESLEYSPTSTNWAHSKESTSNAISDRSKERINTVTSMVNDGCTIDEIATAIGKSPQKVQFFISTLGLA